MFATSLSALILSLGFAQETPQVPGAYRGPEQERTLGADLEYRASGVLGLATRRSGWEFWFEHERELLLRGEPDYPARAVGEDGRYGGEAWSIQRNHLLVSSLPLLVEALYAGDPALREAAALALGRIGYPASQSLLEAALEDQEPAVRQAACLGLGLLATEAAETVLRERFENPALDSATRGLAAVGLGLTGRTGAGSSLKIYFAGIREGSREAADPVLIQAVVIATSVHGSRDFVPLLLELEAEQAKREGANSVPLRVVIFQALGALGDARAMECMTGALAKSSGDLARAAAQALGRLGETSTIPALAAKARATHDPDVRSLCVLAIGRIGGHRATEELVNIKPVMAAEDGMHAAWMLANGLARSKDAYERMRGVVLEGARAKPDAKVAEASAARGDETLRSAAAIGLGLFGNPQAFEALDAALNVASEGDPALQGYLATALGMLRTPQAEERLLLLVSEASQLGAEARRGLVMGLGVAGTERTALALARLLVADADPEVRWTGARALAYARSNDALEVLVSDLRACLEQEQAPDRAAHLVLGLGFLGDLHKGATLDGLVAGMDFLQESRLLDALRAY
jgi:HEAT repeat protein